MGLMAESGILLRCGLSLALSVCLTSISFAQRRNGQIELEVSDQAGAGLEVSGKLENLANGTSRSFRSSTQGAVTLNNLEFGRYRLSVSRTGFATRSLLIEVKSEAAISRSISLPLAATSDRVDVISTTPLAGVDLTPLEVPSPVQTATAREIDESRASNLPEFMNRRFESVHINEVQGNPFQPDVNYRGYTASPLLGTPQGLSIYMDGVRLNQPFGDIVSWDLIPRVAISEVALIPGSNPVFGLNTLGGALSISTKDGRTDPGATLTLSGGSFGRLQGAIEYGGSNSKGLSWFVGSELFFEDGWREASPSNVRQFFGKVGWQSSATSISLTLGYDNNSLTGNGLQEQRFLNRDYASLYTRPDITSNRAVFVNLNGRHSLGSNLWMSGNVYYRHIRTNTQNGDLNEESLDQSLYQLSAADIRALTAAGYTGFPTSGSNAANTPFPFWRCIAQSLQRDEPAEKCNGLINTTQTHQDNYGFAGQMSWLAIGRSTRNQLTVGGGYDGNRVSFAQSSQLGYLNPDRSVTGVNSFGDGVTGGTIDGQPYDTRVDLHGFINTGSVYAVDALSAGKWNFVLSGRYNHTTVENHDRINPVPGPGSLTSTNSFGRFNPSVGATFNAFSGLNLYAGYSEGSRAPTSIELGCADPSQPCKLPNALVGDPPLKQVVTRTIEAGVRGGRKERSAGEPDGSGRKTAMTFSS
jgi:outer membrane receptor protein involved in Fe transport